MQLQRAVAIINSLSTEKSINIMQIRITNDNTVYTHRINKLIQQLDAEITTDSKTIHLKWERLVSNSKNSFWYQHRSSYLFILGCALMLIAIMPLRSGTTPATNNTKNSAIHLNFKLDLNY